MLCFLIVVSIEDLYPDVRCKNEKVKHCLCSLFNLKVNLFLSFSCSSVYACFRTLYLGSWSVSLKCFEEFSTVILLVFVPILSVLLFLYLWLLFQIDTIY